MTKLIIALLMSLTLVLSGNQSVYADLSSPQGVAVVYPSGDPDDVYIDIENGKRYFVYYSMTLSFNGQQYDFYNLNILGNYDFAFVLNLPVGSVITASNWNYYEDIKNPSYIIYLGSSTSKGGFIYDVNDEIIADFDGQYVYDLTVYVPADGYNEGYEDGLNAGIENGYDIGYNDGYDEGYDVGFDEGFDEGDAVGYSRGYNKGLSEGNTAWGVLFGAMIATFGGFLAIEIFPGLTIGMIAAVPLILGLLAFIIGVAKGGKND